MILSSFTSFSFSSAPFVLEIRKTYSRRSLRIATSLLSQIPTHNRKMNQMDTSDFLQFGPMSSKTERTLARVELMFSVHGKSQPELPLLL